MKFGTYLFGVAIMMFASSAAATPNFPPFIEQDLALAAAPDCSICHTDGDQGGLGTVNTPFGKNMRARGLVPYDTGSLKNALDEMASESVDSAGDCLDDIDELKAGHDPNQLDPSSCTDGGAPVAATPQPESVAYGCSAGSATPNEEGGASWLLLAAAVLLVRPRRQPSR